MDIPLTFDAFADWVLRLYAPPLRRASTLAGMRRALADFRAATGVEDLDGVTTDAVARYVASRAALNANTTRAKLRYLRTAVNLARAEGWAGRGPNFGRLMPPAAPACRGHLDLDEVRRLLSHLRAHARCGWREHRLYALVATVAYTGLRKAEALHLEPRDVDLSAGLIHVVARRRPLKTAAAAAPVPLPPELAAVLRPWLSRCGPGWVFPGVRRGGPWVHGSPGYRPVDRIREAGEAVGLRGLTFHALRHTLATLMVVRWGLSLDQARGVLRHTTTTTTAVHYVHWSKRADLAAIGERISYFPTPASGPPAPGGAAA